MSQKLYLPFEKPVLSAAWQHPYYAQYWGYGHYGWDCGADEAGYTVLAPAAGTVLAAGWDNRLGNCLLLLLPDVEDHSGKARDRICRMFHLASFYVKKGQAFQTGEKLAEYGNTGSGSWGKHLHIEFDNDVNWPYHAPGVAGSNFIKRGTTPTVDPATLFVLKEGQSVRGCPARDGRYWWYDKDVNLPEEGRRVCPTCGREIE